MDQIQPPVWLAPAIIAGFLIVFPLFWCSICALLARMGGWSRLAQLYPAPQERVPVGRNVSGSGRVGSVNYKGTLELRSEPAGLRLSVMVLFRFGHPPLFIPWSALRNRRQTRYGLFSDAMQCDVGSPAVATLVLPLDAFNGAPEADAAGTDRSDGAGVSQ